MKSDGDLFDECLMDQEKILSTNNSEETNFSESTSFATVAALTNSPSFFESSPLFGGFGKMCDLMADLSLDSENRSYIQLYSETVTISEANKSALKVSDNNPDPEVPWDHTWHPPKTVVPLQESSSNSYFMNPFGETWSISKPLDVSREKVWNMWDWTIGDQRQVSM
jgi:hypothetical protein